jgi:hypothetical protein
MQLAKTKVRQCLTTTQESLLNYHNGRTIRQSRRFAVEEELLRLWQHFDALTFFNWVMDLFFKLLIFFVVVVLGMGLFRLFWETWRIMAVSELKDAFSFTVTNLLTFFIILELFKSLVEYFSRAPSQTDVYCRCYLSIHTARGHDQSLPTSKPATFDYSARVPGARTRRRAILSDHLFSDGTKDSRASSR